MAGSWSVATLLPHVLRFRSLKIRFAGMMNKLRKVGRRTHLARVALCQALAVA